MKTIVIIILIFSAHVMLQAQNCVTGYCPATLTVHHNAGLVSPATVDITYKVIESTISGAQKCWLAQNLGATQQATAATDATAASAGWYWQFNRPQGYSHNGTTRAPTTTWVTPISETGDWQLANDPCRLFLGGAWRLPTSTEWATAKTGWTTYTNGYNSVLKLHAAGRLANTSGDLNSRGTYGHYWSSTWGSSTGANNLYLTASVVMILNYPMAYGYSVRCLRDY